MVQVNMSYCKRMTCTGGVKIFNYLNGACEIRCQCNEYIRPRNIYVLDAIRLSRMDKADHKSFIFCCSVHMVGCHGFSRDSLSDVLSKSPTQER